MQGHLNPRAKQYTGTPIYTTTHRNNTVNVGKIKHIFIVKIFPIKSVFSIKTHVVHNKERLAWGPYGRGVPGQLPSVSMR